MGKLSFIMAFEHIFQAIKRYPFFHNVYTQRDAMFSRVTTTGFLALFLLSFVPLNAAESNDLQDIDRKIIFEYLRQHCKQRSTLKPNPLELFFIHKGTLCSHLEGEMVDIETSFFYEEDELTNPKETMLESEKETLKGQVFEKMATMKKYKWGQSAIVGKYTKCHIGAFVECQTILPFAMLQALHNAMDK